MTKVTQPSESEDESGVTPDEPNYVSVTKPKTVQTGRPKNLQDKDTKKTQGQTEQANISRPTWTNPQSWSPG